jgi:hypothetical protein
VASLPTNLQATQDGMKMTVIIGELSGAVTAFTAAVY